MINSGPLRFKLPDLLRAHEAELHGRGRSTDPIWRRRSKIYQADRLAREIGL